MSLYLCDTCQTYEEMERLRANTIGGLLRRLGRALLRLVRPPRDETALPRFYCVLCREYVDPKNVRPTGAVGDDTVGAVGEGFLGFQYDVTCHGETKTHYVTLVASMVGCYCHHDAFEPARSPSTRHFEEDPASKARRLDEVERHERRLQKEIAEARARRSEWLAKNAINSKLEELRLLIQNLAIVLPEYEKPGVVREAAADSIQDEATQVLRTPAHPPLYKTTDELLRAADETPDAVLVPITPENVAAVLRQHSKQMAEYLGTDAKVESPLPGPKLVE
jgi:hypothetical protein